MREKIVFFDGNSILNRAYYALPPLNNRDGQNVNAVMGFLNIFLKTLENEQPTKIVVAFDKRGKNFRKDLYENYKANRKGMPDDLAGQLPILQGILKAMQIKVVEEAGVEADDIIGTLSNRFGLPAVIYTGDKDLLQLIDKNTTVVLTKRGVTDVLRMDEQTLLVEMGLTPNQVVDYKALCGDSSDNIPGVSGIGQKGALNLLKEYGDVDGIYDNIDQIKGATKTKLLDGREMAYLSRRLALIIRDLSIECELDACGLPVFDGAVKAELAKQDFNSIIKRINFEEDGAESASQNLEFERIEILDETALRDILKQRSDEKQMAFVVGEDLCFAFDTKKEYHVLFSDNFLVGLTFEKALKICSPLLEGDISKTVYDGKSLKRYLSEFGVVVNNVEYDLDIMQYLAEYRSFKNFEAFKSAKGEGVACLMLSLKDEYIARLKEQNIWDLYVEVELPLSDLLLTMEQEGAKVDLSALKELSDGFVEEIKKLTEQAFLLAGEEFNVLSPKQLGHILFEKLGLPHGKKTKTGYSTDNDVLENIADKHPIIDVVLKIRQLTKLNSTYAEGISALVKNGKVHTHYNQTLTTTGRLSSSDPNLQNIPIRNEQGREIRKAFVPSRDVLVSADYSQIELRWLAYFSKDKNLIEAFEKDEDIHTKVAGEIFGIPNEMVNSSMRRTAKAVNFGVVYGISDFGLAKNVGISVAKAKQYIVKYFERYPQVKNYLDGVVEEAKRLGYVTTVLGRRRYVPELKSQNFALRGFGERAVKNMPLQGSAADLMKVAMLKVDKRLKAEGLKSKIIMQIHDELVVDATFEEQKQVENILREEMENAMVLSVPFKVSVSAGCNLYEAK